MIIPGVEILSVQSAVSLSDYVPAFLLIVAAMFLMGVMAALDVSDILDDGHTAAGLITIMILISGALYGFYHAPRIEMQARIKDTDTFMEVYKYYKVTNIDGDIFTLTERL